MSTSKKPTLTREARRLILLALGSNDPDATEPGEALTLALGAIQAEAEVLTGDTNLNNDTLVLLEYAHASRLEALKGFFDAGYITMAWADTVEERAEKERSVGLHAVPKDGAS